MRFIYIPCMVGRHIGVSQRCVFHMAAESQRGLLLYVIKPPMLGHISFDSDTSEFSIRACLEIIHLRLRGPKHENLYLQPIVVRLRGLFGV